jgi:hypothetical protein
MTNSGVVSELRCIMAQTPQAARNREQPGFSGKKRECSERRKMTAARTILLDSQPTAIPVYGHGQRSSDGALQSRAPCADALCRDIRHCGRPDQGRPYVLAWATFTSTTMLRRLARSQDRGRNPAWGLSFAGIGQCLTELLACSPQFALAWALSLPTSRHIQAPRHPRLLQ